jgi:hypothetical protein
MNAPRDNLWAGLPTARRRECVEAVMAGLSRETAAKSLQMQARRTLVSLVAGAGNITDAIRKRDELGRRGRTVQL